MGHGRTLEECLQSWEPPISWHLASVGNWSPPSRQSRLARRRSCFSVSYHSCKEDTAKPHRIKTTLRNIMVGKTAVHQTLQHSFRLTGTVVPDFARPNDRIICFHLNVETTRKKKCHLVRLRQVLPQNVCSTVLHVEYNEGAVSRFWTII